MCYIVIHLDSLNISNQTIVPPYNKKICCNRQLHGIFTGPFMPCIKCRQQVPFKDGKWKDGETEKIIGQLRQLPVEHILKTGSLGTKCGNSPKMITFHLNRMFNYEVGEDGRGPDCCQKPNLHN